MIEFNGYLTGASENSFQEVCYLYAKRIYFWFGNGIAFDFYADENFSDIFNILWILCSFCIRHDSGSH